MNLSSFAIGAFLSHAATKAHGDMGGTKHLHYRRLSSAGLLLASSLLLAPTATAQNEDRTVPFSTRIGNCDVNDFYIAEYQFPNPPTDRCQEQPIQGGNAIDVVPTPRVIPGVFTRGAFGDDSSFTDGFTLEVEGPCSINGVPLPALPGQQPPRNQDCGLQGAPNIGFQLGYDEQAYNLDQGVRLEIADGGNDSDEFVRNYGICYVPTEDSEPSLIPEVCTIKVTRTQVETEIRSLCIPPRDFFPNCRRPPPQITYFTQDERIAAGASCAPNNCLYGPCIRQQVCQVPACGQGCGPTGCGGAANPGFGTQCFLPIFGCLPVTECQIVCTNELVEDPVNKEQVECEEIETVIIREDAPTTTFTIEVEIDTIGNFEECGDGFCLAGDTSFCDDCANREFLRNIADPPAFIPPSGLGPPPRPVIDQAVLNRVEPQNGIMFEIKNDLEFPVEITELSFFAPGAVYKQDGSAPRPEDAGFDSTQISTYLSDPNNYDLPGQQNVQLYSLDGSFFDDGDGSAASQPNVWNPLFNGVVDFDGKDRWISQYENEQYPQGFVISETCCVTNPFTGTTNSDMKFPIKIKFDDDKIPEPIEAGGTLSFFLFTNAQVYTEDRSVTDSGARVLKLGRRSIIQETPFSGLGKRSASFFGRIGYNIFPPDIDEAVALFFEAVDTEDDGVVSFSEFEVAEEAAAERLGFDISEDEIEALFEKVDENGDGVIDLQEAQEAVLAETPAPTPGAGTNSTLSPTPPPISSSKSSKSNPCAMIKGKKAKKKCLKKAKAPWN